MNTETLVLTALATSLFALPAHATGGISCAGESTDISISTGRLPVLAVLGAQAKIGDTQWSTNADAAANHFVFGQGMTEPNRIAVDFTDPNITRIVVSLRVDTSAEYKGSYEGTLKDENGTTFSVLCDLE